MDDLSAPARYDSPTQNDLHMELNTRWPGDVFERERDACGIGMIAELRQPASHSLVADALLMLNKMEHRGACGCDGESGDGAGVLLPIPHDFMAHQFRQLGIALPNVGSYGLGTLFLPPKDTKAMLQLALEEAEACGLRWLGQREVPTDDRRIGVDARRSRPTILHVVLVPKSNAPDRLALERRLYIFRRRLESASVRAGIVEGGFISLSTRMIAYKGQLNAPQVGDFYLDLQHPEFKARLALVHARFSTNTVPRWDRAHPFNYIAHNGEINTLRGNINDLRALEPLFGQGVFSEKELEAITPVCSPDRPDSANLDRLVELLTLSGRPLPEVMRMLMPPAWEHNDHMPEAEKAYFHYHRHLIAPWDGPAAVCFTDGEQLGAVLDRNGLRPIRFRVEANGRLILASEAGLLEPMSPVVTRGRLQPGEMLSASLRDGSWSTSSQTDDKAWAHRHGFGHYLKNKVHSIASHANDDVPALPTPPEAAQLQALGYTQEDLDRIIRPMAADGKEPIGSMGADIPLAALSHSAQHPSHYFKQAFAQVTNPPIDSIRERNVMSLAVGLGPRHDLMQEELSPHNRLELDHPVLTPKAYDAFRHEAATHFSLARLKMQYPLQGRDHELREALSVLGRKAKEAVQDGAQILLLEHDAVAEDRAALPSLWAVGYIHQHLLRAGLRARCSLVVAADDAWETHHFATLLGFGAEAIYPAMVYRLLKEDAENDPARAQKAYGQYQDAAGKGLLKIMAKMGISTLRAYQGAQLFEAIGLSREVIDEAFTGTFRHVEGLDWPALGREVAERYAAAFGPESETEVGDLPHGGVYQWRRQGEYHLFNPQSIHLLQHATRTGDESVYRQFADSIDRQEQRACTLRGLLDFKAADEPISLEEVEPAEAIMKRFATGAMSFGSLSHEAHALLAVAMNRIGGKSNSGEGGEDEMRFRPNSNGDSERSAIKQIASGRFGVSINYLTHADELQIKMAQGAKPGEGGQLPGHKVDEWIGRVRNATPGVGLISPPPHHDIYSIEDLAQLIYDLKNANRGARINVKLVSRAGIGTIAAGVSKAKADVIMVSGHDGGTGASPLSSIRHAGIPWEIGLTDVHETLVANGLRSRTAIQVDGQIRTGRDLAIATLLGAEEYGVATAALVVEGCILMRKCHLNTCPVGIATQDPDLRKRFNGQVDHLLNYFRFMAEDLRGIMARLGFRSVGEMCGRRDRLRVRDAIGHWKAANLRRGLEQLIQPSDYLPPEQRHNTEQQDHGLEAVFDVELIRRSWKAIQNGKSVEDRYPLTNTDRSLGTMLSNYIAKVYGSNGLPEHRIRFHFEGAAGQSFGAFGAHGLMLSLTGEANDYVGKGLSGATVVVRAREEDAPKAHEQVIAGNVCLYGATAGQLYLNGQAGDRFAVRNSGAITVVEGIGDHGCEYMTGGHVILLGDAGANFGAGMSGGVAWIWDPKGDFAARELGDHLLLDTPEPDELIWLSAMLERHRNWTGSHRAQDLRDRWPVIQTQFLRVVPREFQRVLDERGAARVPMAADKGPSQA